MTTQDPTEQTERVTDRADAIDPKDDANELAQHLVATVEVLADEIEISSDASGGPMGMVSPEMALGLIKSLLRRWATDHPDEALAALARIKLEADALLDHHADEPAEDLLR